MSTFKTFCNKEYNLPKNNTFQTGNIIAKKYPEEMSKHDEPLSEECQNCPTLKNEYTARFQKGQTGELFTAATTICFATSTAHKEHPLPEEYGEPASNTRENYTFEIILQTETLRAYLYKDFTSRNMTAYDHMKNIAETIWNDHEENLNENEDDNIMDDTLTIQMTDLERGAATDIEINTLEELENLIISIRLITYEQIIL